MSGSTQHGKGGAKALPVSTAPFDRETVVPCPRCGADVGVYCTTPAGIVRREAHVERVGLLTRAKGV